MRAVYTAVDTPAGRAAILVALAACSALALTYLVIRWARSRGILDIPNARSSHVRPTPRGGGLSIVTVVLFAELTAWHTGSLSTREVIALAGGGTLTAAIGAWDDVRSIPARVRFVVHVVAATLAVGALGIGSFARAGLPSHLVIAVLAILAILAIVWMTNLYNFMDGIDGIAGTTAAVASLSAGILLASMAMPGPATVAFALGGAAIGFLWFNWPPAEIFLGDVGSGFLGFTFATLALASARASWTPAVWVALPLLPFALDATVTLLDRAARRVPLAQAHREHLYQRAAKEQASHQRVTIIYAGAAGALALLAHAARTAPGLTSLILGVSVVASLVTFAVASRALLAGRGR